MKPRDKKADAVRLPSGSEPLHRSIAQKAADRLGRFVDGNGLKAGQIRLSREETSIHRITASITVTLSAEVLKTRHRGHAPQGTVVGSTAEITSATEAHTGEALNDDSLHQEIRSALKKDPGHGFGMEQSVIPLLSRQKNFSILATCHTCSGSTTVSCAPCTGSGNTACMTCRGNGSSDCQWCHGVGRLQNQLGTHMSCTHCQNSGRIPCHACRGHRSVVCARCRGEGRSGCTECGATGSFTEVYTVDHKAQCDFDIDWRETPPEAKEAAHKLGLRELATRKHAEILWQPPEARSTGIHISCVAFLPVAKAEFLAPEGRTYPALVAGLRARIIEIDPVLDKYVKPGIGALINLSKGPMAQQALIDTACKYRLIRQVMAGLAGSSKKSVYQWLRANYPLMLSDKYARATVKYAANAMTALSAGPRYRGLAAGTLLAALFATAYYMTPLRQSLLAALEMRYAGQYVFAADIAVWLAGWGIAVYAIKLVTAQALKKILPEVVPLGRNGLPSAGPQGLFALLTTGLTCAIFAAAAKPDWIQSFLSNL
jgi:hypothetical protein